RPVIRALRHESKVTTTDRRSGPDPRSAEHTRRAGPRRPAGAGANDAYRAERERDSADPKSAYNTPSKKPGSAHPCRNRLGGAAPPTFGVARRTVMEPEIHVSGGIDHPALREHRHPTTPRSQPRRLRQQARRTSGDLTATELELLLAHLACAMQSRRRAAMRSFAGAVP